MGVRSCGPLCSRVSRFFLRLPAFLFAIFFRIPLCSRVPVSRSYAPVSKSVCVGGGGATHQSRTACVWMDQAGGVNSPLTPPRHACAVYEYTSGKPVWGQTHISSTPPSTSPLSTRHNFVISSQEREFSVPILSRSCIKFAFPRARVPKIPGTREHGNEKQGTRPSLFLSVETLR